MKVLEIYKMYKIYIPRGYKKRIFIDGPGINCNQYWYNLNNAKEHINFVLKYIVNKKGERK